MTAEQAAVFRKEMKRLRKEAGFTTKQFSEYIGVSQSYLINIESGNRKPSPQLAERIAEAFGITVNDMYISQDERVRAERERYGKELAFHRNRKGFSSKLVAGALGIPVEVYKEYEQGLCSITERNVVTLNALLGIGESIDEPKVEVAEKVEGDVSLEICNIILEHITDLQVDKDTQKKVWRYFTDMKIDADEHRLFG